MGARSAPEKGWSKKGSSGSPRRAGGRRTLRRALASAVLAAAGLAIGGPAAAAAASTPAGPAAPFAHACGAPAGGQAACTAIRLLTPARNWHAYAAAATPAKRVSGGGGGSVPAPPSQGYYPADLQSAYGLAQAAAAMKPGLGAPTVAIVDAYNDPTAATDLAAYRASLSKAKDTSTGLADAAIPPLCSSTVTSTCVTFKKVNQSGGTSYPPASAGWSEEISVDLDMVSAICPDCNIVLVEASSASLTSLGAAVSYAKSLHPAAVANSYGAGEFTSEAKDNATYSATTTTAVTAATGDSGYGAEFPAASPGLTAVGGTSLTFTGSGSSLAWNPQTVWSTAGAGCSAYEPMPSWQAVTRVYRTKADCSGRQIGDVSAVADPSTGVAVYDTYHGTGWMVFGGTSVATQIIGAAYGLAAGTGTLQPSPQGLYPDKATGATGPTAGLVPVTSGNDGSCGSYLCNATADRLTSGYNGPTGLGTPDGVGAFQAATATSGSLAKLTISPPTASIGEGGSVTFSATGADTSGNAVTVDPTWSVTPTLGTFNPTTGATTTFTASSTGTGTVTATTGAIWTTASVTVTALQPLTVTVKAGAAVRKGPRYHVALSVHATSSGSPVAGAAVTLEVFSGTSCTGTTVASATSTTGTTGTAAFTFTSRSAGTWCALATVTKLGDTTGTGTATFTT